MKIRETVNVGNDGETDCSEPWGEVEVGQRNCGS